MNKWMIHQDIWKCFDHGLRHFTHHSLSSDLSRPPPPFGPSRRANRVLLNNATATKSHIGWPNFLKTRIYNEWAKLWTKSMGSQTVKACKCALMQALWGHTYQIWIFRNNEDHKNDNHSIAQYKQQALDVKLYQQYDIFQHNGLPLNPLQQSHFDIPQEELMLLLYDICCACLRST
jgi:hypothetical protein